MEQAVESIFNPATLALMIPLMAILCWGVISSIKAYRGMPDTDEIPHLKAEMEKLRARVDQLERAQPGMRQDAFIGSRPGS